jgi:hypothetical protein
MKYASHPNGRVSSIFDSILHIKRWYMTSKLLKVLRLIEDVVSVFPHALPSEHGWETQAGWYFFFRNESVVVLRLAHDELSDLLRISTCTRSSNVLNHLPVTQCP